jgi:hypothetical protein
MKANSMITLRIEHRIASYEGWKQAFDSDPINRKQSGVVQYRIYRPTDDALFVVIELDFDGMDQALATQTALSKMFGNIDGKIVFGPQMQILHTVETVKL